MDVLLYHIGDLNWLAVFFSAVAAFLVGAIWYSQKTFGNAWIKSAGLNSKKVQSTSMSKSFIVSFLSTLVMAAALHVVYDVMVLEGVVSGALLGGLVAVSFVVMNRVMHTSFEQKNPNYLYITGAGDIVSFMVMGAVLALLR